MNPSLARLLPASLALIMAFPATGLAEASGPSSGSAPGSSGEPGAPGTGDSAPTEVAEASRRPAARPTRRPAARRAYRPYRPVTVRTGGFRRSVYRPSRTRVVYVPTRPAYRPYMGPSHVGPAAVTPGLTYISLGAQTASILGADSDRATSGLGGGLGFEFAYGFRPVHALGLETAFGMTFHDVAGEPSAVGALGHLTLDARIYLGSEARALQPYALVGLGAYFTGRTDTSDPGLGGIGFQAGGGLDYFLAPAVSLGVKATYRGAFIDDSGSNASGFATESMWLSTFNLGGDLKLYF